MIYLSKLSFHSHNGLSGKRSGERWKDHERWKQGEDGGGMVLGQGYFFFLISEVKLLFFFLIQTKIE